MDSPNARQTSARAFIRSLNILLKYARLYSLDHTRSGEQFNIAWSELHAAIPVTNESGLLLSATGSQLLLDGVPIDATPAERSFAQMISAAGLASIQFTSRVTKEDFERLVRAFPTQNTKPSVLAEQLKTALAGTNIRINEIRFVAEDASKSDALAAGLLTAQTLGADAESMKDWLRDPQKLLQLIAAAEGSRGESGDGSQGSGSAGGGTGMATGGGSAGSASTGTGTGSVPGVETGAGTGSGGSGSGSGAGAGNTAGGASGGQSAYSGERPGSGILQRGVEEDPLGTGGPRRGGPGGLGPGGPGGLGSGSGSGSGSVRGPNDTGSGISGWNSKDEDILGVLRLLTHLGQNVSGQGDGLGPGPLQTELTRLPAESQEMLRQALSAVAAQAPASNAKDPMLLRLAEHLAIKFALERYQRGEVKVNAVRQMFEKMSQEIEGLRKILGGHEQKLADAGVIVESTAELLDRQFCAAVPERGKVAVLTSSEAWCIPSRNFKQFVEELLRRGDEKTALA